MPEQLFVSYRFARTALELELHDLYIDGQRLERRIDSGKRNVALHGIEGWTEASVEIRASIEPDRLLELLPPGEHETPHCDALLVVRCDATRWRHSWRLNPAPGGCEWTGWLALPRGQVHGSATASVFLVRNSDRTNAAKHFAARRHLRLASSHEWRFVCDQGASASNEFIAVMWEDFASSPAPRRRLFVSSVYDLETSGEIPVLYLNSGLPGLQTLMSSSAPHGPVAAARDLVCDLVAQGTWLVLAAAAGLGSDSPPASAGWRRAIAGALQLRIAERARSFAGSTDAELLLSAVQAEVPLDRSIAALANALATQDG
jgi:hypothetical protein